MPAQRPNKHDFLTAPHRLLNCCLPENSDIQKHTPYLVRRIQQFLRFDRDKTGHKFEAVTKMFRFHLEQDPNISV